MPAHAMVELKARVESLEAIRSRLTEIGAPCIGVFHQLDTYYRVPRGRLKLREMNNRPEAELIYYEREDVAKPKRSSILILMIPRPHALKRVLTRILGIKAIVDKTRAIYRHQEIQIHLDEVKDLGCFVEFELETSRGSKHQGQAVLKLDELRALLEIDSASLQRFSYSDLI